ncbi:hypothetical protein Trydic_g12019, partial [Trypoxylus dichotomus]
MPKICEATEQPRGEHIDEKDT